MDSLPRPRLPILVDETAGFAETLIALWRDKSSGVLHVVREEDETRIHLLDGVPVHATKGVMSDTLGRLLVRFEKITPDQFARTVAYATEQTAAGRKTKFGAALVELGFLTKGGLDMALKIQVREKILRCFEWQRYSAELDTTATPKVREDAHRWSIPGLVATGISAYYGEARVDALLRPYTTRFPKLTRTIPEIAEQLVLPPEVRSFLESITGRDTTEALRARAPDTAMASDLLVAFEMLGFIEQMPTSATPEVPAAAVNVSADLELADKIFAELDILDSKTPEEYFGVTGDVSDDELEIAFVERAAPFAVELGGGSSDLELACKEVYGDIEARKEAVRNPTLDLSYELIKGKTPDSEGRLDTVSGEVIPLPLDALIGTPVGREEVPAAAYAAIDHSPPSDDLASLDLELPDLDDSVDLDDANVMPVPKPGFVTEDHFTHGCRLLEQGNRPAAARMLERAVAGSPDVIEYKMMLCFVRFILEREPADKETLKNKTRLLAKRALEQDSSIGRAHTILGHLAKLDGRIEEAASQFSQALAINGQDLDAQRHLRLIERRAAAEVAAGPTKRTKRTGLFFWRK